MIYNIGNLTFQSKKQCLDYTRDFIRNLGVCVLDSKSNDFEFFINLLKNHEDFQDHLDDIEKIKISNNYLNVGSYHTELIRKNGDIKSFSWNHCCKFKPRSCKENLTNALRSSIQEQVIDYKNKNQLICCICNIQNLSKSKYHTDHKTIPFRDIVANFLNLDITKQLCIPSQLSKDGYFTVFRKEDDDFERRWKEYHLLNSDFQILCDKCNLKKH